VDSEDLSLMPGEGVEIKYHMQKGAGMVYSWKATSNVALSSTASRITNRTKTIHSYGAFTAPTTGIDGWFWENKGKKEVA
jgi:hypothetical protein